MRDELPRIRTMGERAILVEFEPGINEELLPILLFYKNLLEIKLFKLKVEVINTYHSLLINYPFIIEDVYDQLSRVKAVVCEARVVKDFQPQLFHIPVSYDLEFGLDLPLVADEKKLTIREIIHLHTTPIYTVYFLGFLPGFLYLGGLDSRLQISRKNEPGLEVQKGAVGIGENQTGIYPKTSPGGWQIIGNSPIELFDKNSTPPCKISAGDKVRFYPIKKPDYIQIQEDVFSGKFQLKKDKYES